MDIALRKKYLDEKTLCFNCTGTRHCAADCHINMVLNPKKCKEMTLRFRRVVDHLPSALAIDMKALESVDAQKVLGVTIQSNLKWDLRQRGCIFFVSSNAVEYHLPTYQRFILRSLGLSLNTVSCVA